MLDYLVNIQVKIERINEPLKYSALEQTGRYIASGDQTGKAIADALERMAADLRKNAA